MDVKDQLAERYQTPPQQFYQYQQQQQQQQPYHGQWVSSPGTDVPQQVPLHPPGYYSQEFPTTQQSTVVHYNNGPQNNETTRIAGITLAGQPENAFTGHIAFAVFVTCCCNQLFGLISLILIAVAYDKRTVNPAKARSLSKASIAMSVAGIVVTIVIVVVVVGIELGYVIPAMTLKQCPTGMIINGICYQDNY